MKEGEGAQEFLNLSWKLHQNTFCQDISDPSCFPVRIVAATVTPTLWVGKWVLRDGRPAAPASQLPRTLTQSGGGERRVILLG